MFSVENLMDLSGLAGSAVGLLQGEKIHRKEVADATRRHEESLSLATAQHVKDMKVAKQTYLMSAFTTLEQHFQVGASIKHSPSIINDHKYRLRSTRRFRPY